MIACQNDLQSGFSVYCIFLLKIMRDQKHLINFCRFHVELKKNFVEYK